MIFVMGFHRDLALSAPGNRVHGATNRQVGDYMGFEENFHGYERSCAGVHLGDAGDGLGDLGRRLHIEAAGVEDVCNVYSASKAHAAVDPCLRLPVGDNE